MVGPAVLMSRKLACEEAPSEGWPPTAAPAPQPLIQHQAHAAPPASKHNATQIAELVHDVPMLESEAANAPNRTATKMAETSLMLARTELGRLQRAAEGGD